MKRKLKNIQMEQMVNSLRPLLSRKDEIGYYAARNFRIMSDSLTEYYDIKNNLILKYGEPDLDENGNQKGSTSINVNSTKFDEFVKELSPFCEIEHEIDIMVARYDDIVGKLTGEEILAIDWMLED